MMKIAPLRDSFMLNALYVLLLQYVCITFMYYDHVCITVYVLVFVMRLMPVHFFLSLAKLYRKKLYCYIILGSFRISLGFGEC